jgi:uncharacterized membrane protein
VAAILAAAWFASAIAPTSIDQEGTAVTLAALGAVLAYAWTRVDSRALKWGAALSLVLAPALFVFDPGTWTFPTPPRPIANWHLWTLLVPAACSAYAATRIGLLEPGRARGFELSLAFGRRALAARAAGLAAVAFGFVWINVEVAVLFASGDRAGFGVEHAEVRALANSIAWAAYALALLALGVVRNASGPRWASLVLFLVTIAKVFLFDLGHLEGLQRAASMLGLALSLIIVSLVYQRFVFRREPKVAEEPVGSANG